MEEINQWRYDESKGKYILEIQSKHDNYITTISATPDEYERVKECPVSWEAYKFAKDDKWVVAAIVYDEFLPFESVKAGKLSFPNEPSNWLQKFADQYRRKQKDYTYNWLLREDS